MSSLTIQAFWDVPLLGERFMMCQRTEVLSSSVIKPPKKGSYFS
jgi:hypothetical protein